MSFEIGGLDVGVKTIVGFILIGLGYAIGQTFPTWFPIGLPWDSISSWVVGFGITLAGIGARHAIAKIGK